jgi:probable HAF family extracellular repeat protein
MTRRMALTGTLTIALTALLGSATTNSARAQSNSYTIQEIPLLPGTVSNDSFGITNSGFVAGRTTTDGSHVYHVFRWKVGDSGATDLGTLGGKQSFARGVNESGEVVGQSLTKSGDSRAVLFSAGRAIDVTGKANSIAFGINNLGHVVGRMPVAIDRKTTRHRAFRWQNGTLTTLPLLTGMSSTSQSWANDLNDAGEIVGVANATGADTDDRPVLWRGGAAYLLGSIGYGGAARAISEFNGSLAYIAGEARRADGWPVAARWTQTGTVSGTVTPSLEVLDLSGDVAGSSAWAVNALGVTVGLYWTNPYTERACLWSGGVRYDLNDATLVDSNGDLVKNWVLSSAMGINDKGQIAGYGILNGATRGFVLTPLPQQQ